MNQLYLSLKSIAFGLVSGTCYVKQLSAMDHVRQNGILGVSFKKDHIVALYFILPDIVHGSFHQSKCQLAMFSVHYTHQRQKPNGLTLSLGMVQWI